MHTNRLTFKRILAIGFILAGATIAWAILAGTLQMRTESADYTNQREVKAVWGPAQGQPHPQAWYQSPTGESGKKRIQPTASNVHIDLEFEPKKKGLSWSRTYLADFSATYTIPNPTPIDQTIYVSFELPSKDTSYNNFIFSLGDNTSKKVTPRNGSITEAVNIPANGEVDLQVAYQSRGINHWGYDIGSIERVSNFHLHMVTNFEEIDFPNGASSPTSREFNSETSSWSFAWHYPDVINPAPIAMDMPKVLNPGPVATRISFFAPISLLFFFAVLMILGAVKGINLHPMNYFFIAAGFFVFQILFAYLVDLIDPQIAFITATTTSIMLVGCYIKAVAGSALLKIALPAQIVYLTLFSYSFFFDGLSGLTITIGSVATLAVLMIYTAKVDWSQIFMRKTTQA